MDDEIRLAKVETFVETIREDIDRLEGKVDLTRHDCMRAIDQLRHDCMEAIERTRQECLAATEQLRHDVMEANERTRQECLHATELVHQEVLTLRQHTDQGLEVLRKEHAVSMRWMMAALLGNTCLMAGLFAKVSGWY